MQKLGDVMVGFAMLLGWLAGQVVVIGIVVGLLTAVGGKALGWTGKWWIWTTQGCAALLLNWLTFIEFKRMGGKHKSLSLGGTFFMLPRAIFLILHGRETYHEIADDRPGFPVLPVKDPGNAPQPPQSQNLVEKPIP